MFVLPAVYMEMLFEPEKKKKKKKKKEIIDIKILG